MVGARDALCIFGGATLLLELEGGRRGCMYISVHVVATLLDAPTTATGRARGV